MDIERIESNIILSPETSSTVTCTHRPPSAQDVFNDRLEIILNNCNFKREIILMDDFSVSCDVELKTERNRNNVQVV